MTFWFTQEKRFKFEVFNMSHFSKGLNSLLTFITMFTLIAVFGSHAKAQDNKPVINKEFNLSQNYPKLFLPIKPQTPIKSVSPYTRINQPLNPIKYPKTDTNPPQFKADITKSWQFKNNTTRALTTKERTRVQNIRYIMIHHTAMSNDDGAIRELESSLFAHYSVLKSGQIYQHLENTIVAEGSWDRSLLFQSDENGNVSNKIIASGATTPIDRMGTIHIEVNYAPQKGEVPNSKQVQALADLISDLALQYNIPPTGIIGHSSVQTCGSSWFKDYDGDWFRVNEPGGIMYTYSNSGGCKPVFNSGLYNLVSMIRSRGVWKEGNYTQMTDRQVANVIYLTNYGNAEQLLNRVGGRSVASLYRKLINELKD